MTVTPRLLDLRHEQSDPFPEKRTLDGRILRTSKVVRNQTFARDPKTISGISLHQTACVFGPASDRDRAHRRALKIPAHVTAFRDGVFVAAAPLRWYLYHGNDLNFFTLGLEVEGQYPGLPDDPSTPRREDEQTTWKGIATPLDALTIATACAALTWLVEKGRAEGMPIETLYAHRQANGDKPSDPGYGIWRHVVLDHGVAKLGLRTVPDATFRDGRPIPKLWEPTARGKY